MEVKEQTERLLEGRKDPRLVYPMTETILIEIAIALSRQADAVEHRNTLLEKLNANAASHWGGMKAIGDALMGKKEKEERDDARI